MVSLVLSPSNLSFSAISFIGSIKVHPFLPDKIKIYDFITI